VKDNLTAFFSKLTELQLLVIERPETFELPLVERVGGVERPLSFLVNPLKQLHIDRASNLMEAMPANKAIWFLCFCPLLKQAILYVSLSIKLEKFLEEHHQTFSGLSNIEDLALGVTFIHDPSDRSSQWGLLWERRRLWRSGSRRAT